ncbi:unnamed protein product [Schistosoma margrebowiei]|uniref:Uncharacterized protein n=1 Tax=Schistosoma margrebowiei TaxID=48269 RepID=A0A183N2U1_9TREM|nr:unnamed protein product [Schistosoma margrebowiei]
MYLKHRSECWKTTSTGQHNDIGKMRCLAFITGIIHHANGVYPPHHDILEFVWHMIRNKFVSCVLHFQQSRQSYSKIKELIFEHLQKVGARENRKFIMDGVLKLHLAIRKIHQETAVDGATQFSIEDLKIICPVRCTQYVSDRFLVQNATLPEEICRRFLSFRY